MQFKSLLGFWWAGKWLESGWLEEPKCELLYYCIHSFVLPHMRCSWKYFVIIHLCGDTKGKIMRKAIYFHDVDYRLSFQLHSRQQQQIIFYFMPTQIWLRLQSLLYLLWTYAENDNDCRTLHSHVENTFVTRDNHTFLKGTIYAQIECKILCWSSLEANKIIIVPSQQQQRSSAHCCPWSNS